ncbi:MULTISPECIES: hypothetical protein [unclassified Pseudarthrobacter]|uniref:hypothetical protein n=1 Tax=unclassified Pseudarthrobacter TaxID=2647000 RepID=UPI0036297711
MLDFIIDLSQLVEQQAPLKEHYDTARQIIATWGDGPELVEFVLLEPLGED